MATKKKTASKKTAPKKAQLLKRTSKKEVAKTTKKVAFKVTKPHAKKASKHVAKKDLKKVATKKVAVKKPVAAKKVVAKKPVATKDLLNESLIELIRKTSAELPDDVQKVILEALHREEKNTTAEYAMNIIKANIELAKKKSQPLCQDTGTVLFFVFSSRGI